MFVGIAFPASAILSSFEPTICISSFLANTLRESDPVLSEELVITWMQLDLEPWMCHIGYVCISKLTGEQICKVKIVLALDKFRGFKSLLQTSYGLKLYQG